MKIILKREYRGLGKKGEVKEVADGFSRNFLIPQDIALPATPSNVSSIIYLVQEEERVKKQTAEKLESLEEKIKNLKITLEVQTDVRGKLFGAVGQKEIQKEIEKKIGVKVPQQKINLDKPIKKIGNYEVMINISEQSQPKINIQILPLGQPLKKT